MGERARAQNHQTASQPAKQHPHTQYSTSGLLWHRAGSGLLKNQLPLVCARLSCRPWLTCSAHGVPHSRTHTWQQQPRVQVHVSSSFLQLLTLTRPAAVCRVHPQMHPLAALGTAFKGVALLSPCRPCSGFCPRGCGSLCQWGAQDMPATLALPAGL